MHSLKPCWRNCNSNCAEDINVQGHFTDQQLYACAWAEANSALTCNCCKFTPSSASDYHACYQHLTISTSAVWHVRAGAHAAL